MISSLTVTPLKRKYFWVLFYFWNSHSHDMFANQLIIWAPTETFKIVLKETCMMKLSRSD